MGYTILTMRFFTLSRMKAAAILASALVVVVLFAVLLRRPAYEEIISMLRHGVLLRSENVHSVVSRLIYDGERQEMMLIYSKNNNRSLSLNKWIGTVVILGREEYFKIGDFNYMESRLFSYDGEDAQRWLFIDGDSSKAVNPKFRDYHTVLFASRISEIAQSLQNLGFKSANGKVK